MIKFHSKDENSDYIVFAHPVENETNFLYKMITYEKTNHFMKHIIQHLAWNIFESTNTKKYEKFLIYLLLTT